MRPPQHCGPDCTLAVEHMIGDTMAVTQGLLTEGTPLTALSDDARGTGHGGSHKA
jgi:hypothetical protein|eukprot:COSAG01_NODE_5842_length_4001_cov_13.893388_8_plen_55_part_00